MHKIDKENLIWIHITETGHGRKSKKHHPDEMVTGSFFEPKRQYECLFESKFSDWAFSTWLSRQYRCCLYDSWQQRKVRKYTELWKHWPQSPQERIVDRSVIELQSFNLEQRGLLSNEAPFLVANATNKVALEFGSSTMRAGFSCERQTSVTYPRVWSHDINNLLSFSAHN